jgi:putative transposase
MSRKARIVIPGLAHHITQRGNYRQQVFYSQKDFQKYSYWMNTYAEKYRVKILAYCLMKNHVHFIVVPSDKEGLARLFNAAHMLYSQYRNSKTDQTGHLWQGRFYSCVLGPQHLYRAIRYVEMNPVRAKIVSNPWEYVWSSTRAHLDMEIYPIIKTQKVVEMSDYIDGIQDWKNYLLDKDEEIKSLMRVQTKKGLVVAHDEFISEIENKYRINLRLKKMGRPKSRDSAEFLIR